MIGTVPRVPRDFTPAVVGYGSRYNMPVEVERTAYVLRQTKPVSDGGLEGINALHDWRRIVGAFAQQYAASYKTFNERHFREAAGWDA